MYDKYVSIWDCALAAVSSQIKKRDEELFGYTEDSLQGIISGINLGIMLNNIVMVEGYLKN